MTSEVRRVFTSLYFYPVNKSQTQKPKQHTLSNELAMSQPRTKPKLSSVFLPDHIIDEILSWVPAKSLIRFRCVSKSRYLIITNPIFISTHFNRAKLLFSNEENSNNYNGYLLYTPLHVDPLLNSRNLCTVACNSDCALSNNISRIEIPFSHSRIMGFSNAMFCFASYVENCRHIMYLWNPSIRKFKMLAATVNIANFSTQVAVGFAYHSQNNDFKVLRIVCNKPAEAEVYTVSTDSWRRCVISVESSTGSGLNGSISGIDDSPCVFLNGALHSIACTTVRHNFILSFDLNDEKFREIMLPCNYFHGLFRHLFGFSRYLAVSKGLLTFIVFGKSPAVASSFKCFIWVMREYGVSISWTSKIVNLGWVDSFYGCADNGEFLIEKSNGHLFSFDHESLEENSLGIQFPAWVGFTSNLMESLVLLE